MSKAPLGISVFCLRNTLLEDVKDAGFNEKSTIYDLEDLREKTKFGVIRTKGANVECPRDQEMGSAYVDCLQGTDNVGPATRMLSYVWGYTVGDIIDSLESYCAQKQIDTKATYVWICCLCNNQHRVGDDVPFTRFHEIFHNTVVGVGHILAMMAPWDAPLYLTRVWCIFEIHTANTADDVKTEIIMPPREKDKMLASLNDYNNLVKALSATHIESAEASKELDRDNIMKLVNKTTGGAPRLNSDVNTLLRDCFEKMMVAAVDEYGVSDSPDTSSDLNYASLCYHVGRVMGENGKYDKALEIYDKCRVVREKVHGMEHTDTASAYNDIAMVMKYKGDLEGSLEMYRKALTVQEKVLGVEHPNTAISYNNIAQVMQAKGDLDGALEMYHKSLAVREKVLGSEHTATALSYNNIAVVMKAKGDLDGALELYHKSLAVFEKVLGVEHTSTATTYNNIAGVMKAKGDLDGALEWYHKCLAVQEKVLGTEHTSTGITYYNMAVTMEAAGDIDGALEMFHKCHAVEKKALGEDHPDTLTTKRDITRLQK